MKGLNIFPYVHTITASPLHIYLINIFLFLQLTPIDDCLAPHGKREIKNDEKRKIMPKESRPKKERKLAPKEFWLLYHSVYRFPGNFIY